MAFKKYSTILLIIYLVSLCTHIQAQDNFAYDVKEDTITYKGKVYSINDCHLEGALDSATITLYCFIITGKFIN
jgi:hypothetical protein